VTLVSNPSAQIRIDHPSRAQIGLRTLLFRWRITFWRTTAVDFGVGRNFGEGQDLQSGLEQDWALDSATGSYSSTPFIDQAGHQPGPTRLVAGSQPRAGVPVVVLIKEKAIAPMRVGLEPLAFSEASSSAKLVARKNQNHAFRIFLRHGWQCIRFAARRGLHVKIWAECLAELQQGMGNSWSVTLKDPSVLFSNSSTPTISSLLFRTGRASNE
jgi:hypothetical protein